MLTVAEIATRGDRIIDEVERAVVGKREALELVLLGFLADGHVLDAVTDRRGLLELQESIEQVHVSEPVGTYIVDIVASTRTSQRVQVGASPRGSLAILKLARVKAALAGRDFVTPEDVKAVAVPALSHRLMLKPELWVQRVRPEDVVRESLETVPAPAAEDLST